MVNLYNCKTKNVSEKKFEGRRWGDLTEDEQESFLRKSYVDNDNLDRKTGECIIDFESLSVGGKINLDSDYIEYVIDDDAILYDSNK